jgi:hypothetical protein
MGKMRGSIALAVAIGECPEWVDSGITRCKKGYGRF